MRLPSGAPILSAAAMRAAEEAALTGDVTQDELMERAGAAVAREVARFAGQRSILVLAGPGNNGGDGYVAARWLKTRGHKVQVAALGAASGGAAARMRALWRGETVAFSAARPCPVLVDGLFGTGLTRPLEPPVASRLAELVDGARFVLAIDLPSGLDADSGAALGAPGDIDMTVALGALKPAHLLGPGVRPRCGHVLLADIGIPVDSRWRTVARPVILAPASDAHKYSRGLVVVLEGAMPGAARLAARAAAQCGAGYVIVAGPEPDYAAPDALVRRRIDSTAELAALLTDSRISTVVVGPGLGRDQLAQDWLDCALACPHRLVIDGDALTLLGRTAAERVRARSALTVLTPHDGEFAAMFDTDPDKITATLAAAKASGAMVIHKGADTVLATPVGQVRVLADASSWLSTAGSGDVLAGIVAARFNAPAGALWLHARAARLAGRAFIADDLIAHLPQAMAECR